MVRAAGEILLALAVARVVLGSEAHEGGIAPELPSDQDLLARIAALPDNTWLKLPPPKVVGDMGILNNDPDYRRLGPCVRDYCNRMVWAPDRQRALYCGGGHNVHPYNDVWEFDLAANTWVCLYGADPVPPRTRPGSEEDAVAWYKANAVLTNGVLRSKRGAPLRPCHSWWSFAYDSDRRLMLFLESHKGLFAVDKGALARALKIALDDPMLRTYGSGSGEAWLFSFDPASGRWKDVLKNVPKAYESACLEYLPEEKTVWWHSGKTYRWDPEKREWVVYSMAKGGPWGGAETAYDPEMRQIVATHGLKTWIFKCVEGTWNLVQTNGLDGGCVPLSTFCYDTVARRFVLYTHMKLPGRPEGPRLRLYDQRSNQWYDPAPPGDVPQITNVAGYYDPARNVTVIYNSRETWVYRCKRQ